MHASMLLLMLSLCLQSEMCHPQRAIQDVGINEYAFIRVHVHPKRFPAVYTVNWKVSMHAQRPASCLQYMIQVCLCFLLDTGKKYQHLFELSQYTQLARICREIGVC